MTYMIPLLCLLGMWSALQRSSIPALVTFLVLLWVGVSVAVLS